jgi:metal-responsive CopG/Arc/MetJ family transcriptional regulator
MAAGRVEKTQISIRLSEDLLVKIQELAKKGRRSRSNMIEFLLQAKLQELEEKKEGAALK